MPVTNYVWDEDQYLMETDETNTTQAVFTNEPDESTNLISQHRGGASQYAHFDALGSTRQLTDDAETATDDWNYDAWGNVASRTGLTEFPFQFVGMFGYFYTPETNAFYVVHRILGPDNGRWLSPDPRASIQEYSNLYEYVANNPIIYIDIFGHQKININCKNFEDAPSRMFIELHDCCPPNERSDLLAKLMCEVGAVANRASNAFHWVQRFYDFEGTINLKSARTALATVKPQVDRWFSTPSRDPNSTNVSKRIPTTVSSKNLKKIQHVLNRTALGLRFRIGIECETSCADSSTKGYTYITGVPSTFADTTNVHLCPKFWNLTYKQQIGTLYHEVTHEYAGTKDYAYLFPLISTQSVPAYDIDGEYLPSDKLVENADTYAGFVVETFYK